MRSFVSGIRGACHRTLLCAFVALLAVGAVALAGCAAQQRAGDVAAVTVENVDEVWEDVSDLLAACPKPAFKCAPSYASVGSEKTFVVLLFQDVSYDEASQYFAQLAAAGFTEYGEDGYALEDPLFKEVSLEATCPAAGGEAGARGGGLLAVFKRGSEGDCKLTFEVSDEATNSAKAASVIASEDSAGGSR